MFNHQQYISKCLFGKTVKDVVDDPLGHAQLMHSSGIPRKDACLFFQSIKDFHDYPFLVYYNSQYIKPVYTKYKPVKYPHTELVKDPVARHIIEILLEKERRANRKIQNLYRMLYQMKS